MFFSILLLFLLSLVFFHKILLNPNEMIYPAYDIVGIYSFEKFFFVNTFQSLGVFPLWNPHIFSGVPFIGNPWSAMFYPLSLIYFLFPIDSAFGYLFILDIFLLGVFTFLFLRIIKLRTLSSLFSAILIMFSGPVILLFYSGHLLILDTFMWFPLLLLFGELYILQRRTQYAILSGLVLGLMFLAGHTQVAVYSTLAYFIYLFLRFFFDNIKNISYIKRLVFLFITTIIVGFSLAATQLLPGIELSKLSVRNNGLSYEFASDFSLHPKQIISFFLPHFFGSPLENNYWGKGNFEGSNGYLGILPLILVIIALIFVRNIYKYIFLILGLFSLIYSFGKYSFLFPFFYHNVPGFDSFRVSARFLLIYAFSLSVLAGFGTDFLISNQKSIKKKLAKLNILTKILKVIVLISIVTVIFVFFPVGAKFFQTYILRNSFAQGFDHFKLYTLVKNDIIFFTITMVIIFSLFALKIKNLINNKIFISLLFFITAIDLFFFGSDFINTKNPNTIYKQSYLINEIKKDKDIYRVFDMPGKLIPVVTRNDLQSLTGIHSIYPRDYRDFLWSVGNHEEKPYESFFEIHDIQHPIILDLLNTKYIISEKEIKLPQYEKLDYKNSDEEKFYLYKNKNALPRAYLVPSALIVKDRKSILNKVISNNFDPKKIVLLEKDPKVNLQNLSIFKPININSFEPNEISLSLNLQKSGFLVLSEVWYPGWKAFDNGKEKEIYRTNYVLRSIHLDKGNHEIIFSYDPQSYKIGKIITFSTIALCGLYLLFMLSKFINRY